MDILLQFEESDERSMLEDLQLAAELGKTLLERNKELEGCIKQQGGVIEDQAQEIEYLTKQTAALREVNDSRLRIYEQLEVSIQDLERANQRLVLENASDKKHVKSLCVTIDTLEARCEELQATIQELQSRQCNKQDQAVQHRCADLPQAGDADQVSALQVQLQDLRQQRSRDHGKLVDLEEQLAAAVQENSNLEDQMLLLRHKQEVVSSGEELRQGYLCTRCLKKVALEDDSMSVANSTSSDAQRSAIMQQMWDSQDDDASVDVAYQMLVEKYEALLKMQQGSPVKQYSAVGENCLSLQDELRLSGDFNSFNSKNEMERSSDGLDHREKVGKANSYTKNKVHKAFSGTPTEFSEAETSSSGFSDETSNKATQTDSYLPGYFLCSVAEGDDCKISIYDDINPVESRFRKTPEYKQLFREIFVVLKRAAEQKSECEQAAVLNATCAATSQATATETAPKPEKKIIREPPSSKEQPQRSQNNLQNAKTMMKPLANMEHKCEDTLEAKTTTPNDKFESYPQTESTQTVQRNTDSPKPKHDILEYLALGSGRKKSHSRKNSPAKGARGTEKVERIEAMATVGSCVARLQANGNRQGGRRRRDTRVFENQNFARDRSFQKVESWDFNPQPFVSSASQEVAKLKRLEKSYAEVLRLGPKKPTARPPFPNSYRY